MPFTEKPSRRFEPGRSRFVLPRRPPLALLRVVAVATLGIVAAAWALWHHLTHTPAPMHVPVAPSTAPTYDVDAGEMPVPDVERSP